MCHQKDLGKMKMCNILIWYPNSQATNFRLTMSISAKRFNISVWNLPLINDPTESSMPEPCWWSTCDKTVENICPEYNAYKLIHRSLSNCWSNNI